MSDPFDLPTPVPHHLMRAPLPWHGPEQALTECGHLASGVRMTTVPDVLVLVKRVGKDRALYNVCRTCMDTANRHSGRYYAQGAGVNESGPVDFATNPLAVMLRWMEGLSRYTFRAPDSDSLRDAHARRTEAELRAIAALVEAHRDEFDSFIAGLTEAVDLSAARTAKTKRARP